MRVCQGAFAKLLSDLSVWPVGWLVNLLLLLLSLLYEDLDKRDCKQALLPNAYKCFFFFFL